MTQFKGIILGSLLLAACTQTPVRPEAEKPSGHAAPQEESTAALPNLELNNELLFQYLISEIASQRGESELAAEASAELAKKTRDPRLAARAAQLALQSGQMDKAVEAIKAWREIEPESPIATRALSAVLLRSGRLDEARQETIIALREKDADAGQIIYHTYQVLASYPDNAAALKFMRDLAQQFPQVAEAHWAVAQLAVASGDEELALNEAKLARSLRGDWDMAVSLEALLLKNKAPQQGLELLRAYLAKYPEAGEIRLQYARALLEEKLFKQARDEFRRLADEAPDNPEMAFAIALISLQLNDLQSAETQLKQALSKGKKDQETVQYYLGQLSEAKNNEEEALERYRKVNGGEHQFAAQIRIVYLLNKRGQPAEARQQLHQMKPADDQQRAQLALIEAQLLRTAKQHAEAYRLLRENLEKQPTHPDLLYETGMAADLNGEHAEFERLIRKLIQIKPDHAHAYNALGYSFLERNERLAEGMELVKKALQLDPEDPAIMDSVGWGYYRSGNLDESLKMLRRAFAIIPDPEIAAHLGEVLWQRGDKEEAKKIWRESLKANQESAPLQAVMKRFMP
ncbi:MAG: tetratricopeptide repeat protein [Gallionella sp.]|nr:tetratricopeptide repeat protein [Gallionella sp.]